MALSAASKNRREMRCVYCDVIRKCTPISPVWAKKLRVNLRFRCDITDTPNRPSLSICGQFTLRYTRVNAVSANQRRAKQGEIPDHLIIIIIQPCRIMVTVRPSLCIFLLLIFAIKRSMSSPCDLDQTIDNKSVRAGDTGDDYLVGEGAVQDEGECDELCCDNGKYCGILQNYNSRHHQLYFWRWLGFVRICSLHRITGPVPFGICIYKRILPV